MFDISIIVSSYKRLNLFKRTLYSLDINTPNCSFELVVADELSDESDLIVKELEKYKWPWKVIQCEYEAFEKLTGIKKTGNPSWTNNVAWKNSSGKIIATLGNDILIVGDAINHLIDYVTPDDGIDYIVYSSTYDLTKEITESIGEYGEKFTERQLYSRLGYPSNSNELKTGVTNYLSISPRQTWDKLDGYCEFYMRGLAAEDSSFTKRVGLIPNSLIKIKDWALTFHQYHGGISQYYDDRKDKESWEALANINRAYYHSEMDDQIKNPQTWPVGFCENFKIISNW